MQNEQLPVARESVPFLAFGAFATLVFALLHLPCLTMLSLLVTAFVLYFFRDPVRVLPVDEGAIIAPADGKIIQIEEVADDRFLKAKVRKISIFMNVFNVHVNRTPFAGTVETVRFRPGRFYAADNAKAELHNEYCALTFTAPDGGRYTVVQVAGLIARRIVCRAEPGDTLKAGQRFGLIRFGSRVDLYLPLDAEIRAQVGDKTRSGETVLGIWPAAR